MTTEQLVKYLRLNIRIQDPDGSTQDKVYLSMTDEEILLYLQVAMSRDFSNVPSLDLLPTENIYPLTLLARKDLYFTLATAEAPLFDIGADNNNYLKRSQRFEHYMKLIAQADKEYQDYLDNGGAGSNTLSSYDVLLPNRYYTLYNYEKGVTPAPSLFAEKVSETSVDLMWRVKMSKFYMYRVYVSESPIVDLHLLGNHILSDSTLVTTIRDVHQTRCTVEGLEAGKTYHVAVAAVEKSLLTGYSEIVIETPPAVLSSLEIINLPVKTDYIEGELLDTTGLVISGYYSDGTLVEDMNLNEFEFNPQRDEPIPFDTTYVTISYQDGVETNEDGEEVPVYKVMAVYQVWVYEKVPDLPEEHGDVVSLKVVRNPYNIHYIEGEFFNPDGLVIYGTVMEKESPDVIIPSPEEISYEDVPSDIPGEENYIDVEHNYNIPLEHFVFAPNGVLSSGDTVVKAICYFGTEEEPKEFIVEIPITVEPLDPDFSVDYTEPDEPDNPDEIPPVVDSEEGD